MNKVLVEVYCPITNQNYDIYIPKTLVFSDIKILIGKIIENISMNTYFQNYDIVLCDFNSGKMIDDRKTPQDLGVLNGYKNDNYVEDDVMDENEIAYELNKIIRELYSLASQIESDFEGIGEDYCASSLRTCAKQYSKVVSQLQNVKTK